MIITIDLKFWDENYIFSFKSVCLYKSRKIFVYRNAGLIYSIFFFKYLWVNRVSFNINGGLNSHQK